MLEENVVEEIQKLHRSFTSLARDIHCKLDELVKSGKSSLRHITTYVQEAQVGGMQGLTEVNTIDDLFSAIHPHNDYLDCELLEMIVEEYLDDDDDGGGGWGSSLQATPVPPPLDLDIRVRTPEEFLLKKRFLIYNLLVVEEGDVV